jgi:diguanylate cyclase (GGDEF)-like protein/PAS domain S-box-containing protein
LAESICDIFTVTLVLAGVTFPNTLLADINDQLLVYLGRSIRYLSQITFVIFLFLFPNGKFYPRWLNIPVILWPILLFIPIFGSVFAPDTYLHDQMKNARSFLELTFLAAGLISQLFRFRNYSEEVERQQTKWVIFGFALVLIAAAIINVGNFVLRQTLSEAQAFLIYDFGLITVFGMPAAGIFPILIGVSITRFRLWDLQTILSRIIIYFFVIAVLFVFGVLCVYLTQYLIVEILGRASGYEIIVAVAMVVIFAGPIYTFSRRKITELVYPSQIKYIQEIEKFSNEVRVLFENNAIAQRLSDRISAVVKAKYCRVYQLESPDDITLINGLEHDNAFPEMDMGTIVKEMRSQNTYYPGPETDRIFVSLINNKTPGEARLMGLIELGPKASGKGYSRDEIMFLRSIGSEAALALYVSHIHTQSTLLAAALEYAANGIALVNSKGSILWVNPAFNVLTGYTLDEMVGKAYTALSDVLKNEGESAWEVALNKKTWTGSGESMRKNGDYYYEELTMTPVIDDDNQISHLVVIKNDISDRVEIQEKLEHLATHDPLTNLPNRILFNDRLNQALAVTTRTGLLGAVLYLDLDDFKAINDVYTHELGDLLLFKLAQRMQAAVRAKDTIARIGGDEFALLLVEIDNPTDAGMFGERIIKIIKEPISLNDINVQIAGSIGISIFPDDGTQASTLIRNADIAMYRAKRAGKGQVAYFTDTMSREVQHNLEIRNILRTAVKDQRLRLVFQSQIEVPSNRLRGLEALLRLDHPEAGIMEPEEFLDLADKSGTIVPIEDWVLDQTIRVGSRVLQHNNEPVKMAVNVSSKQLFSDGFIGKLSAVLARHAFPAKLLELELTENSVMQDPNGAKDILQKIKRLGVGLAIDDFGTGHSSLNHLAQLPFDLLKIGQGFTAVLVNNLEHEAVFNGIITIAHNLEIGVIVEGVETASQLKFLTERGIDMVQGFYFSKPVSEAETIAALLKNGY